MRRLSLKVLGSFLALSVYVFASDSVGISGTVTTLGDGQHVHLEKDWNLVGINSLLTLQQIKDKVGQEHLLVIQGVQKRYDKSAAPYLNTFTAFEKGRGYWVKVDTSVDFDSPVGYDVQKIELRSGWNIINPPKNLTLAQIKQKVGSDNLLAIVGPKTKYEKGGQPFLNTFTNFKEPNGYWIKVAHDKTLVF